MTRPPHILTPLATTFGGWIVLGGLTYAAGPPLAAVSGASAVGFALGQTLLVAVGSWLIGRYALRRHVRAYEERLAPRFTGGMFLWSNSVHTSTTTMMVPEGTFQSASWSAYGGSTEVSGTPIDLAIEGSTWTFMASVRTGHRLWYQHGDHPTVRNHYEAPPSTWGPPATPDDHLDRLSAIGPEALEHLGTLVVELAQYEPALFIHPDMVRVVLYNVFDPPNDAPWSDAGHILNRVVDLAASIQPAEAPIRTSDAVDVFYRDWFTTVEGDYRLRAWLMLGSIALLVLFVYGVVCEASLT